MVVLINGSREFNNYSLLEETCYKILGLFIERGDKIIIIEGDARGADKLAGKFAKENNFELELYPADWSLGKQAGLLRNIEMVEGSRFGHKPDILISFNMGTRGTQHTIDYWKSKYPNKPVYEIKC